MEWQDEAVVLTTRRHGETSAVVGLFTRHHGRHAGLVRGATSRRLRPVYQPGNRVQATWRARLAEHLGTLSAELQDPVAARLLDDADRLAGLGAALALIETTLGERDPHPNLYNVLNDFFEILIEIDDEGWCEAYVHFELELLAELGFGLDLTACAVTGAREDLAYVSPRSGRAVSRAGAGEWADRLLPLPGFLIGRGPADADEIRAGLRLTGAFLRRHVFDAGGRAMPGARERLIARLDRATFARSDP